MGFLDIFKKRNMPGEPTTLHGVWMLVRTEGGIDIGDGVEMDIQPNGNLIYAIRQGDKLQIMKMVYRVEGDELVTNQPSAPREERTRFEITDGVLALAFGGARSWFRRKDK